MTEQQEEKPSGTYEAGCHCGYIKFSVKLSPPLPEYEVLDCGCSMCAKSGYLLVCKSAFSTQPSTNMHISLRLTDVGHP